MEAGHDGDVDDDHCSDSADRRRFEMRSFTSIIAFDAARIRRGRHAVRRTGGCRHQLQRSVDQSLRDGQTLLEVVYGGLGLAATSFAGTFFVAPYFSDSLKESEDWIDIYPKLVAKGTQSITPLSAAAKLSDSQC